MHRCMCACVCAWMWASAAALLLPSDRGGDRNEAGWRRGWRAGRHCSRQTALLRPHCSRAAHPSGHAYPQQAAGHRVSRPRGTGSVGDSVGEGACLCRERGASCLLLALCASLTQDRFPLPPPLGPARCSRAVGRRVLAGRSMTVVRVAGHLLVIWLPRVVCALLTLRHSAAASGGSRLSHCVGACVTAGGAQNRAGLPSHADLLGALHSGQRVS